MRVCVVGSRQTASGLGSIASRTGGLISPLVNMLATYHPSIPTIIFGVLSIISGSLGFLLPETRRKELPDSIHEAENNGYVDPNAAEGNGGCVTEHEGESMCARELLTIKVWL